MKWKILLRISLALSDFQIIQYPSRGSGGQGANVGGRSLVGQRRWDVRRDAGGWGNLCSGCRETDAC